MKVVKYQIKELLGIGMTFVVLGIGLAYGLLITSDIQDDIGTDACAARTGDSFTSYNTSSNLCYNGSNIEPSSQTVHVGVAEFNGTASTITGVAKIPNKLPTIATVVVAAVILGVLVTYLWARFR